MNQKVRIITSLNHTVNKTALKQYIETGIDEFYFGFMPAEWTQKFGWEICSNRRPYPVNPHITDWDKAKEIIDIVRGEKKGIILALNEHQYNEEQLDLLIPMLGKFINLGITGVLISDPGLIVYLKYHNFDIPVHLSIGAGVYNKAAVEFFYNLGVKRIVLPRKLHFKEITKLIDSSPGTLDFEVFLIGEWCRYNDAYCFNVHGYNKNEFCKLKKLKNGDKILNHRFLKETVNYPWCGLCLSYYLKNYYSRVLFKIPLRSDVFNYEVLIKEVIPLLKKRTPDRVKLRELLNCDKKFCAYAFT